MKGIKLLREIYDKAVIYSGQLQKAKIAAISNIGF